MYRFVVMLNYCAEKCLQRHLFDFSFTFPPGVEIKFHWKFPSLYAQACKVGWVGEEILVFEVAYLGVVNNLLSSMNLFHLESVSL